LRGGVHRARDCARILAAYIQADRKDGRLLECNSTVKSL
jgi:hypothetical protein